MTFPNKGENHVNGIKNEKDIVNYMNKNPNNNITKHIEKTNSSKIKSFKHQGGTKQKMDMSYDFENGITKGVSIKHHGRGTFDWINTTKGIPQILKSTIEEFKKKYCDTPISEDLREELNNIFSNFLNKLISEDITELLSKVYRAEENTDTIIINDKKNNRLIMIPESNLDPYCNSNHGHTFMLKSTPRARTSRQIWLKSKDGCEVNTHLRIRLTDNNGIHALLGKSTKNKTSVPCLKIQQDNVDDFIERCFGKVIVDY